MVRRFNTCDEPLTGDQSSLYISLRMDKCACQILFIPTNDYETKTYPESRLHPRTRDTFTKAAVLLETDLHE